VHSFMIPIRGSHQAHTGTALVWSINTLFDSPRPAIAKLNSRQSFLITLIDLPLAVSRYLRECVRASVRLHGCSALFLLQENDTA